MTKPWTCDRRGDCCTQPRVVVMSTAERDILRARSDRAMTFSEPDGLGFVQLAAGPCPLYDDGGCTVYDVRPFNCRRYLCGREGDAPFEDDPVPIRFYRDREFRRQMQVNQRHHQRWARAHGWAAE